MTSKEDQIRELYEGSKEARQCREISIAKTQNFVSDLGHGDPNSDLVFVGEAPGSEENRMGIPFVGQAGKTLNKNLNRIGLERSDVWVTNVVKFRPTKNDGRSNRKPTNEEINACLPLLKKEIEIIDPEVIVPLGLVALNSLTGKKNVMKRSAGKVREYDGIKLFPMYHPAALIYNKDVREKFKDDFDNLKSFIHSDGKSDNKVGIDKWF